MIAVSGTVLWLVDGDSGSGLDEVLFDFVDQLIDTGKNWFFTDGCSLKVMSHFLF